MKNKKSKNYTLYWMAGISAVLTVPIAAIIISKVQAGDVEKTAMITGTFLLLFIAAMLLYKSIFKVSVQEMTQEDRVTELDRLSYTLAECRKMHTLTQLRKCIDIINEQIKTFQRRRAVLFSILGEDDHEDKNTAFGGLVESVEDILKNNIRRFINRVEIFDDRGMPDLMRQNLGYLEDILFKNNEILTEFEKLIAEASQMGESKEEQDITKLRDVIDAMQSLRKEHDDEIDDLAKKYDKQGDAGLNQQHL